MGQTLQQSLDDGRNSSFSEEEYADGGIFDIDLRALWGLLLRNAKWAALIVVGVVLAGLIVTMLISPRYLASARILIEDEGDQIIEGSDLQNRPALGDVERFLQTQEQMVHSIALAQRIVDAQKLAANQAFFAAFGETVPELADIETGPRTPEALKALRSDAAIELLRENLRTELPADSRIITISFESTDPQLSANLANAFADGFIEMNLNRKFDSSSYARQFLASQLEAARTKVEVSERDLNRYSRAAGLIRVDGQKNDGNSGETTLSVTNDALLETNQAAIAARAERIAAEGRWNSIAGAPLLAIPDVIQNPAIQGLTEQKAQIEAKLADERSRHFDNYPTIKTLTAQVKELDGRINTVGGDIKKSIRLNYEASIGREETMLKQVQSLHATALDEQDRGVQYNVLKRVAETDRALYQALLERYNQINASAGAASNNVSLVDRAQLPNKPSSPKLFANLLIALFLGVIAAGAFIFLREYFDDTIRSPDDVEGKLGLPLLGLVPLVDEAVTEALRDPRSHVSEAYQSLVTNLSYATPTGLPRSLAVTSANESEGKSTSALAIARDVAQLGKRVLLIDTDLRRPTLHGRLANKSQPGLTELLTGKASFEDVAIPSETENLTFMTALPMPVDPSRILGSPRFSQIVSDAISRYDLVVFDCPPMLGLSDTATVSTHADGVLFVTDASRFQRGAVKASLRRLALVKANVIGVLLTKFDPKSGGNTYAYYGHSSYYGYGADKA